MSERKLSLTVEEAERLRRIEVAARRAEQDCRRFIEGTFARVDEIRARESLNDLREALR